MYSLCLSINDKKPLVLFLVSFLSLFKILSDEDIFLCDFVGHMCFIQEMDNSTLKANNCSFCLDDCEDVSYTSLAIETQLEQEIS